LERNEEQVGAGANPDSAVADRQPGQVASLVVENRAAIELAVTVGVLKNQDAVLPLAVLAPVGIGKALRHPQPPAIVKIHGNRLTNMRLPGEQRNVETLGGMK